MEENEKIGYQFVGWYIDPECTKRINPGGVLPCEVTLYDKWIPIWYPIEYHCAGGLNSRRNPSYVCIESGEQFLYPAKKRGFMFEGWKYQGELITALPSGIHEPVVLEAVYKELPIVCFDSMGGGNINAVSVDENGFLPDIQIPMRLGYDLDGWYLDPDYHWRYSFDEPIREACTLYAKWKLKTFRITYDADGGFSSRLNPKTYTYVDATIHFYSAYKKGYIFIGWFDERGNKIDRIPQNSLGDKKLIAHYRLD